MNQTNRVTTPIVAKAIVEPVTRALLASGFEGDAGAAANYLMKHCTNPALGLWMAQSDGQITGILAVVLPTNPLVQTPEIVINANWGPKELGRKMVMAAIEFVKDSGYDKIVVVNRTGRSDKLFQRLYGIPGRTMRPLGTLWEFMEVE